MHLWLSEELRSQAQRGTDSDRALFERLSCSWPAFSLGSVAPDFQTICGIPRATTHFYKMPPRFVDQGWKGLLAENPELYPGKRLDPERAAFTAAYLVHLLLDLRWHFDVVMPYFADMSLVGDLRQGYLLHVTFLTYLDNLALRRLPETATSDLAAASYEGWLPFAADEEIESWRKYLLGQMGPGVETETIKIFAGRLQMTADEFSAKLNDPAWMERELFSRIPAAKIERQLIASLPACLELVRDYIDGRLDLTTRSGRE